MSQKIPVIVPAPTAQTKSMLGKPIDVLVAQVDVARMKSNLDALVQSLGDLFEGAKSAQGMTLKEVEVGLEITAEGGVSLVGTFTAGAKAALTLTFERS